MITPDTLPFDNETNQNILSWLEGGYNEETKQSIRNLLTSDPEQLKDSFYTKLSFGTGGLRGLMGIGSNRLNNYTIAAATQGLANYLLKTEADASKHSVIIGYDSRHHSKEFAEEAAKVLAGNGIKTYLFYDLRPTPLVSFGCRYFGCSAGIMITASHNPPAYNGYKVYWNDGAQVLPPHDSGIIAEVNKIVSPDQVKTAESVYDPLIKIVREELDNAYIASISSLELYPQENKQHGKELAIIYSGLHGTGITLTPLTLHSWGFDNVHIVKEQSIPNGLFPTVKLPNPEDPEAMQLGIELLKKDDADIFLATDPDADRVGIAVKHNGQVQLLTGHQIACICLYHILDGLKSQNKLPQNAACIKTLPTTEMFTAIAKSYGVKVFDVLTGFKYIAEKIGEWDKNHEYTYVFGGEESYGYLYGTQSHDKDALISCAVLAEAALKAKLEGKTLVDVMNELYAKYGHYSESLLSINFPETKEGKERMRKTMETIRANPPRTISGHMVIAIEDYLSSKSTNLANGSTNALTLPKSDVLLFRLENDGKVIVRPSGTEPKVKVYVSLKNASAEQVASISKEIKSLLQG